METKHKTHEDDIQKFIEPILKRKGDENNTIDLDAYALGLIDAYKELYASEENRKKDEPKQSDVERLFTYFPNHGDESGRNEWTVCYRENDDEIIITCEDTEEDAQEVCKRLNKTLQSQQPVSIQWLSDDEISNAADNVLLNPSQEAAGFEYACMWIQSELRNRVNVVDPVEFAIGFKHWCFEYERAQAYIGMSDEELINAYKDHLTSKNK